MNWNINIIPESDKEEIMQMYDNGDVKKLMIYHNKSKLSGDIECCDKDKIMSNFKIIIDGWRN